MNEIYILRCSSAAARKLAGCMIVLSTRDSTLFRLNETATAIWEAADGVTPLREIAVREICSRFNVAENTAYLDAESVVRQLGDRGLLILSNTPVTPERR